jgi:hypothetical protein
MGAFGNHPKMQRWPQPTGMIPGTGMVSQRSMLNIKSLCRVHREGYRNNSGKTPILKNQLTNKL